jgi:hypothetical protein
MSDEISHIEALRTQSRKALRVHGRCRLSGPHGGRIEEHHEKYDPERKIIACHKCHHRAHFRPWELQPRDKEKLLLTRHGAVEYNKLQAVPAQLEEAKKKYVAPGRRPAQLEVRREVRERAGKT